MAVTPAEVDVSRETFGGLVKDGETPEEALRRLEKRRDYTKVIGSDDGQRLLEAATNQVEESPNGGVKPKRAAAASPAANGAAVEAFAAKVAELAPAGKRVDAPTAMAIPIAKIETSSNVRVDLGNLDELVASIRDRGILQPIIVTELDNKEYPELPAYRVLVGHRRLAAAAAAGYETVPAILDHRAELGDAGPRRSAEQLVENLQRLDLNPLEEARALKDILDGRKDLTQADVARWIGKDRSWVSNALRLLETAPEVQAAVQAGTVSATHARAIAGVDVDLQPRLLESVVDRSLSAHETESQAKYFKDQAASIRKRKETADQRAAAAIALLEKVANPETAQVGVADFAGGGSELVAALAAKGWKATDNGYSWEAIAKAGSCGCEGVWRVEVTYQGQVGLKPACLSGEHRAERRRLVDAKWKRDQAAANEARKKEREEAEAAAAGTRAAIVDILAERPTTPLARRILIYALLLEDIEDGLVDEYLPDKAETLYELEDAPWTLLEAIPDENLEGVQAKAVADFVGGYSGGPGVRAAIDAWVKERAGVIATAEAAEAPAAKERKRLGKRVRLDDPLFVGDVEYVVISITGRGADPEATHVVEAVKPGPVKASQWKDSRIRLALGSLVADAKARVWRADEQLALTNDDDEDLRPKGEVNADALRGEVERSIVAEAGS